VKSVVKGTITRALRQAIGKPLTAASASVLIGLLFVAYVPNVRAKTDGHGDSAAGAKLYPACTSCHGAKGQGNTGMAAPKLTGLPSFYLLKQMQNFQSGARGMAAGDSKGRQMAAMSKSPRLTRDGALEDLVAYIQSLPDEPANQTLVGDEQRGKALYNSCASCHGASGQGIESMGAPPLAGQSDWYLLAQLQHFAKGRRGYERQDHRGQQMQGAMSVLQTTGDYQAVVAYINTLGP
jgi:cytochrome c oxidase subunit 2